MLYKTFRGAVHYFYFTYFWSKVPPSFEFYLHIFIADGYPVDRLFYDESILRVRHCSVFDCFFKVSDNYFVVTECAPCSQEVRAL